MRLTEQQALVMFDITKSAMNTKGGFAGYSNEDLMKFINEVISQQDNTEMIDLVEIKTEEVKEKPKKKNTTKKKKEVVDIVNTPELEEVVENIKETSNVTVEVITRTETLKVEEAVEELIVETISEDVKVEEPVKEKEETVTDEETDDFW